MKVGFFGKLPSKGDFLTYGSDREFAPIWDQWLQKNMAYGLQSLAKQDWQEAYLISPLWRFYIMEPLLTNHSYAGFFIPSVDSVGRYFPFTVYVSLDNQTQMNYFITHSSQWFKQTENFALSLLQNDHAQPKEIHRTLIDITETVIQNHSTLFNKTNNSLWIQSSYESCSNHLTQLQQLMLTSKKYNCFWWTDGSETLNECTLLTKNLPCSKTFLTMICGTEHKPNSLTVLPEDTEKQNKDSSKNVFNSHAERHAGHIRKKNEDAILVEPHRNLWAVADGLGGEFRGEIASYRLVNTLKATPVSSDLDTAYTLFNEKIKYVNDSLLSQSNSICGTTLALLFIQKTQALCLWIGDSRIYGLTKKGELVQITEDHCDQDNPHALTKAIGASTSFDDSDSTIIELNQYDRLLLCTDGLYNVVSETKIHQSLTQELSAQHACQQLLKETLKTSADDNVSIIVIDL